MFSIYGVLLIIHITFCQGMTWPDLSMQTEKLLYGAAPPRGAAAQSSADTCQRYGATCAATSVTLTCINT